MEKHLTILLISGLVLLSAFYGYNVEQRIVQIKKEFYNEMKKANEELKSIGKKVNVHINEMIQKENACKEEIDQTNENVSKLQNETMKLFTETNNSYVNRLKDIQKGNTRSLHYNTSSRISQF